MNIKPMREIEEYLAPVAASVGAELLEAVWNNRERSLTLYIDAPGGVDLDLCEAFHHAADAALDELDPTFGAAYTLNCSSPGLDRPFRTARDFERNLGKEVEVKLFAPLKGKKLLEGVLEAFDENSVTLKIGDETEKINKTKIAKINKAIQLD